MDDEADDCYSSDDDFGWDSDPYSDDEKEQMGSDEFFSDNG